MRPPAKSFGRSFRCARSRIEPPNVTAPQRSAFAVPGRMTLEWKLTVRVTIPHLSGFSPSFFSARSHLDLLPALRLCGRIADPSSSNIDPCTLHRAPLNRKERHSQASASTEPPHSTRRRVSGLPIFQVVGSQSLCHPRGATLSRLPHPISRTSRRRRSHRYLW